MSLNREQAIFMSHVAELIRKAPELGLSVTGGELYRTQEQQQIYVRDGRSKTVNSQHLKRLAIDLNFFRQGANGALELVYNSDEIRQLGAFWESLDPANRWGGNWDSFKDVPHFERREGYRIPEQSQPAAGITHLAAVTATTVVSAKTSQRGGRLLSGNVGARMPNSRDDVETLQRLLNMNHDRFVLATELTADGIIGQKTIDALRDFQRAVLGIAEPEGVVRPGDSSLLALCEKLPSTFDETILSIAYLNAADSAVVLFLAKIIETMRRYQIDSPLRKAHFLAQIGHESGELRFRGELASGAAYEGRHDLGNSQPGDGKRFKGRGLIQLTGRANYARYNTTASSIVNGADIVADPDLVASDDRLCCDVAGWFWNEKQLNLLADKDDIESITRRINGGLDGLAERRKLYTRFRTLFGLDG